MLGLGPSFLALESQAVRWDTIIVSHENCRSRLHLRPNLVLLLVAPLEGDVPQMLKQCPRIPVQAKRILHFKMNSAVWAESHTLFLKASAVLKRGIQRQRLVAEGLIEFVLCKGFRKWHCRHTLVIKQSLQLTVFKREALPFDTQAFLTSQPRKRGEAHVLNFTLRGLP